MMINGKDYRIEPTISAGKVVVRSRVEGGKLIFDGAVAVYNKDFKIGDAPGLFENEDVVQSCREAGL